MNHADFVNSYKNNQIAVDIDKNKAGFLYEQQGLMPQNLRIKQAMLRAIAFGGVILSIVLFFYSPWWVALGVLFAALFMFPQAQKNAAFGVLQASLDNPIIYAVAIQSEIIAIRELA